MYDAAALPESQATSATVEYVAPVRLVRLFPTWLYVCAEGPGHLNDELERLTRNLMEDPGNAARRPDDGGWHYAFDLFEREEPVVAEFRREMTAHVQSFLDFFGAGGRKEEFRLQGRIDVNGTGDGNTLRRHPGSFVSATYYVKTPADMKGGCIAFRDPRGAGVAMHETPGLARPWGGDGAGALFAPAPGLLLLFPAWLENSVEPFDGTGDRISIAFNASTL